MSSLPKSGSTRGATVRPAEYPHTKTILVADDDTDIRNLLCFILENEGFRTITARNGSEAIEKVTSLQPDLAILDIMMPGIDGLEVCKRMRQYSNLRQIPILMLTALTSEDQEIKGLETGADDYLFKPIAPRRLLSRVNAILRRVNRMESIDDSEGDRLSIGSFEIDRDTYSVRVQNDDSTIAEVEMPKKEFDLLYFLALHPGKIYSRQDLLDNVWGTEVYVMDRTVDVHISKIREKLGSTVIETVKGVGYRFKG